MLRHHNITLECDIVPNEKWVRDLSTLNHCSCLLLNDYCILSRLLQSLSMY